MLHSTGWPQAFCRVVPVERARHVMERDEPAVVPNEPTEPTGARRPSPSYGWIAVALITIVVVSVLALLFLGGQVESRFGPVGNSV